MVSSVRTQKPEKDKPIQIESFNGNPALSSGTQHLALRNLRHPRLHTTIEL